MPEQGLTLERLDHRGDTVVATHPKVVSLADIVGEFEQVIVTAAVEQDVPAALRVGTVRVEAGTLSGTGPAERDVS